MATGAVGPGSAIGAIRGSSGVPSWTLYLTIPHCHGGARRPWLSLPHLPPAPARSGQSRLDSVRRTAPRSDAQYAPMPRSSLLLLVATALCWGSSFAFIKVAITGVEPLVVMTARAAIGATLLWVAATFLSARAGRSLRGTVGGALRERPVELLALGLLTGLPLWLVAAGEQHVDSGLAGIANASVPLWAALLAVRWDQEHPTTPLRLVGVAIGLSGIVFLAVARGRVGGGGEGLGLGLVACASLLYAMGGILVRERLSHLPSVEVAAWSVTVATALFVVPATLNLPDAMPRATVLGSIFALGAFATFLGFLCYYELLARVGAARAAMVTYLLPPLAVGYGWALLDERVGPESVAAMAVVLIGVWLGSRTPPRDHAAGARQLITYGCVSRARRDGAGRARRPGPTP